jgi:hypothetical protein
MRLHYEGSPGLWHLLLWCLIRLGLPYQALWTVSGSLAVIGAAILLWRAPFPAWLRLGVIFSYFFAFQYAVVARGYALDLVLLPWLAALFEKRTEKPILYGLLLGILANCNAYSFLVSGVLGLEFLVATVKHARLGRSGLTGLLIYAALALAAVCQAWPAADVSFAVEERAQVNWYRPTRLVLDGFLQRADFQLAANPDPMSVTWGAILSFLLIVPSLLLFRRAGTLPVFLLGVCTLLGFAFVQHAAPWHAGLIFLLWVLCLWVSWTALPGLSARARACVLASIAAILTFQAGQTAVSWWREITRPYSGALAAAQALHEVFNRSPNTRLAALGMKPFAVQPYFSSNIFANYHEGDGRDAYLAWRISQPYPMKNDERRWLELLASRPDLILIARTDFKDGTEQARLLAARDHGYCNSATFPGEMIWKGFVLESDDLLMFGPCEGPGRAGGKPPG